MPDLAFSGIVICLGSLLFLTAAFSPSSRLFGASNNDEKLVIINSSLRGWRISQVLFRIGAGNRGDGRWFVGVFSYYVCSGLQHGRAGS